MQCSINVFSMLSLGCSLISDLVVNNLFMHSLTGMILLYLAAPFLHQRCICMRYGYAHLHVHIHMYIHTYIHTYINTYTHTFTYIHTYKHTYKYVCTHITLSNFHELFQRYQSHITRFFHHCCHTHHS